MHPTARRWIGVRAAAAAALLLAGTPGAAAERSEAEEASGPASGAAGESREAWREKPQRTCATLGRQVAHFEDVVELAEERDDELWRRATEEHIQRLEALRERRGCVDDSDAAAAARAARMLKKLGRLALTAMTMGAF